MTNEKNTAMLGSDISRRRFCGLAGATALTGALMALAGCGSSGDSDSGASEPAKDTIRFGCEAAYAPYEWKQDDESEYTLPISNMQGSFADGYDIQLMKAIADKLGKEPVVVNMAFTGLIAALQNGEIDAICAGMSATEERKKSVDFSDPYLKSGVAIMVKSDSQYASATELADFSGASVLGQKSSLPDSVIEQIPGVKHLDPVDNIPDSLGRLEQGTVDAVVVDANNKNIYERVYPDCTVIVFEDGKGFDTPGVDPAVAVVKGDPEGILAAANEVIDAMSDDDRQQLWDECSERAPK